MFILHRIVELQAKTITRLATSSQVEYDYIESLIESSKPRLENFKHHYLIATPFRYPLPVGTLYQARFRPPFYSRNSFYGATTYETSAFETGFHFLRQRIHLKGLSQTVEPRTHFKVSFNDANLLDITRRKDIKLIMDRKDYSYSHAFILKHPKISSISYPSCRDPEKQKCVCTFEINTLGKKPRDEKILHFIYNERRKACAIENPLGNLAKIDVTWEIVS